MEPVKEATLTMRGTLDPNDPTHKDRLTGVLLTLDDYYDPRAKLIEKPEDFVKLLQASDQQGKPLYIMAPHPGRPPSSSTTLEAVQRVGSFYRLSLLSRTDQTNDRVVARYQPGSVRDFDLDAFSVEGKAFPMRMSRRWNSQINQ